MRGGREVGIGNAECGWWKKRRLEDGKMRRWGEGEVGNVELGMRNAEGGKTEVEKMGR
jgi:hypothetical protein